MITYENSKGIVVEDTLHQFSAEASTLSTIVPEILGHFPKQIKTTMGNGQPFIATSKKIADGDLLYVRYIQAFGCIHLKVFND